MLMETRPEDANTSLGFNWISRQIAKIHRATIATGHRYCGKGWRISSIRARQGEAEPYRGSQHSLAIWRRHSPCYASASFLT